MRISTGRFEDMTDDEELTGYGDEVERVQIKTAPKLLLSCNGARRRADLTMKINENT